MEEIDTEKKKIDFILVLRPLVAIAIISYFLPVKLPLALFPLAGILGLGLEIVSQKDRD